LSAARRVLLLRAATASAEEIDVIVQSLSAQGAAVVVRDAQGDYEAILDEIAAADTILSWR
jgi:hypothetical protein